MADFYFKTLGQVWSAMAAAFTGANQLTYNSSGFSITWTTSSAVTGGYFVIAGTTFVGDPYANGNYHASEAKTAAHLPLSYVLREAGMGDIATVTRQTAVGALSVEDLLFEFQLARQAAIVDVTGAVASEQGVGFITVTGGTDACVIHSSASWATVDDVALDVWCLVNQAGQPVGAPVTSPPMPTYQMSFQPTVVTRVDVGPQLDNDVAINNGSVIDTVVAKQFTGI
jgi:hypothetical protein